MAVAALALGACGTGDPDSSATTLTVSVPSAAASAVTLPTPSPQELDVGPDAVAVDFGFGVSSLGAGCFVDGFGSLMCTVDDAVWATSCLSGEAGAIVLTTEGTLDHGCVQGSVGQADGGVEDLGVGTAVTLGGGDFACRVGLASVTCWETATQHWFVVASDGSATF